MSALSRTLTDAGIRERSLAAVMHNFGSVLDDEVSRTNRQVLPERGQTNKGVQMMTNNTESNVTHQITDAVQRLENELAALRIKSDADDKNIALLNEQNAEQATEILAIRARHDSEMLTARRTYDAELSQMRQERNVAVQKYEKIKGIVEGMIKFSTSAVRVIVGDDTPEVLPDRAAGDGKHPLLPQPTIDAPVKRRIDGPLDDGLPEQTPRFLARQPVATLKDR